MGVCETLYTVSIQSVLDYAALKLKYYNCYQCETRKPCFKLIKVKLVFAGTVKKKKK
jgi:hypothetical protein